MVGEWPKATTPPPLVNTIEKSGKPFAITVWLCYGSHRAEHQPNLAITTCSLAHHYPISFGFSLVHLVFFSSSSSSSSARSFPSSPHRPAQGREGVIKHTASLAASSARVSIQGQLCHNRSVSVPGYQ